MTLATATVLASQSITPTPNVTPNGVGIQTATTYQSNATGIATVSASGDVTGVAPGSATITVRAIGTGPGFTTNTVFTTVQIAVSSTLTDWFLSFSASGTIEANDRPYFSGVGRVDWYRVGATPSARIVELRATSTVSPAGVPAQTELVVTRGISTTNTFSGASGSGVGYYFLPATTSLVGALSRAGTFGTYKLMATLQQEDLSAVPGGDYARHAQHTAAIDQRTLRRFRREQPALRQFSAVCARPVVHDRHAASHHHLAAPRSCA